MVREANAQMISGVLMAAELVKYVGGLSSALQTFFQLDTVFPLQNACLQMVRPVESCYCWTRRQQIRHYRDALTQANSRTDRP